MLKKFILLFVLLIPAFVFGNDILDVSLDKREIFEGENIKLVVEIAQNVKNSDNFKLPKIEDFLILSRKDYIKNGKKYVYEYVITPKTYGFFTIPAITVYDSDKNEIVSNPIEIKVNKTKVSQAVYTASDVNTFVKAYTDTNAAYVNQQVYYTLEFATRYNLASNPNYLLPMFRDFWKTKSDIKSGYELINGENYFTFTVTTRLYPMRDGIIIIDPSVVDVKYLNGSNKYSFKTNPIKIKIFPLPQKNIPENFTGAVGKYYISSSVNKKSVKINEPVNLSINIKGNGNINSIAEPVFELSSDIKKYATFVKVENDPVISSKKFQCVLIPLMSGQKNIPEITFSYFDPDLKNYVVIKSSAIFFDVNSETYDAAARQDEQTGEEFVIQKNLKPVKDVVYAKQYKKYLVKNKFFMSLLSLFLLFAVSSFVYRIVIIYMQRDYEKIQKIKAYKKAEYYLKNSYDYLRKEEQINFYTCLEYAVKMFLRSKTNIEYLNMSKNEIEINLKKAGDEPEFIKNISDVLKECEIYKFKSVKADILEMNKIYYKTKYIIKEKK
ncbi:MAG: BatD family protein [Endomicrobiaceae bacterium]|jgi:hypothetical protein|nr:BatD family protein [Endomicrobiaceae bacterium]MDD3729765.1 BatD family protein [Endomicrobiaceae bacterium]MDD4165998.1 BatD family protein [Endomicrobiaceae bacterium]